MINKIILFLKKVNIRSVFYNFYILPFSQAIHLPLLISRRVHFNSIHKGAIEICSNVHLGMIQIGYNTVSILDYKYERTIIDIQNKGKIVFNGKAFIGSGARLSVHGIISFGKNVIVNGNSKFLCLERITISNNVLISWDCQFMDADFHKIYENGVYINPYKEVQIEENVLISSRVTVLKGAVISAGSVIAAGAVITKELSEINCLYGGIPARLLKHNITWTMESK